MDEAGQPRLNPPSEPGRGPAPALYPDYANPDLLCRIPLSARTVLDVGCAQGALGAAYLRLNPRARVLGIERNHQAAERAEQRLDGVACVDVEAFPMPFDAQDLDCIVYGDILEHLVDPWRLLEIHAGYLAPGGSVLICMPNMEHWSIALRLLNGNFDYEPEGLLDRSHLRWFTPRTMARALRQAGLELVELAARPAEALAAQRFTAAMAPALQAIGVDPQAYLERAQPLQFVWRASKSVPPRMVLRATSLPPVGGVSDVRVTAPIAALTREGGIQAFVQDEAEIPESAGGAPHIAILHRPLLQGEAGIARVRALLSKGYLLVTEFDDHPNFMAERGVDLDDVLSFKAVHAVQVSTPVLADILRPQNPEIGIFPNAIAALREPVNFEHSERLTLFFGALNRQPDWQPLMPTLNEVAGRAGGRLNFSVIHDQAFFDALETPHKRFTPTCDYPTYLDLLASSEIAFMPLHDTAFNRAKSDLKFIEAAAARVAALAGPVVYEQVIKDGATGLIFRDPAELRSGLLRLLAYPQTARRMADAARAYVAQERMLAYQVTARVAWYRALWARRETLTAALAARVPMLFSRE